MGFYENFLYLSNSVGKSPSAVALEIGISKPTVNRWKNGGGLTDATARKVADYFGITKNQLLGAEPIIAESNKKTPTPEGERDYQSMIEAFENADESTREAILLLLKLK